jgi:hypothetical protein
MTLGKKKKGLDDLVHHESQILFAIISTGKNQSRV